MRELQRKQSAFTLIEMLVALTIGLIIIAGVFVVYLSSKKTFNLNSNMLRVHDNGRFAINYLVKDIQRAGWIDNEVTPSEGFTLTKPVVNTQNNFDVPSGQPSDILTVRYYGDKDCTGASSVTGIVENTYQLAKGESLAELQCNGVTLLKNVESFQVLFGVLAGQGLRYVNADELSPHSIMKTIQIGVSVASQSKYVTSKKDVLVTQVLDEGPYTFQDGRYRQVFTNTILLNNSGAQPPVELLVSE